MGPSRRVNCSAITIGCVAMTVLIPAESQAQARARAGPVARAVAETRWAPAPASPVADTQPQNDPARDGALKGAVIGGLAVFAAGMSLCRAVREEGDPACLPGALLLGARGAAAGAVIGGVVDASRQRRPGVRFTIRF